jgi:UDP-2,4-diacetamido-2,4,6-trideoxy-beta-L-altropyranose hydrolase
MTRVVLRCDAALTMGSGHVMRCVTLAATLRDRGADIDFVCRALPAHLHKRIAADGAMNLHVLRGDAAAGATDGEPPLRHRDWLCVSQAADAAETLSVIAAGPRSDWLVVDSYALDARWERAVRPAVDRLMAIDDLADRDHDCDILLDQNFFLEPGRRYTRKVPAAAELLLGPRFALLRPEFARMRDGPLARDGTLRRLFVSFGSSDPMNLTARAVRALAAAGLDDVALDVVIGSDNPHRAEIEALCAGRPRRRLHVDSDDMAGLMAAADLAIGAGGATTWERCCLRLPTLLIGVAENQYEIARDLAEHGACVFLGREDEVTADAIAAALRRLAGSGELVRALGARAGALADGHGARRVADRMVAQPLRLRAALPADCARMHEWRNAEVTRRFASDPAPIAFATHARWFERTLNDPRSALLVAECATGPVGVLRYDFEHGIATVSVYLVPGTQGRGAGTSLLQAGTRWLRDHHPEIRRIRARVKADNLASLGAFSKAGFSGEHDTLVLEIANERTH